MRLKGKMSFDVNVLSTKPIIKAAANMQNDGGSGGNLGYMEQGEGEKEKKQQQFNESIFAKRPEYDIVDFKKDIPFPENEQSPILKLVVKVIQKLKFFFK